MVIYCPSVFLFGFDYLSAFVGKSFFLSTSFSFSFMYSSISPSSILRFHLCPLFFNLPAPGLHGPSYTERNSIHVVLYIWKIWRSWERQRWICQVPSFPLPYPMRGWKNGIYVCLSELLIFRETGAEWDYPAAICVCSLSRLWVGRDIS